MTMLEMPTVGGGKPQLMSHSRWSGYLRCPNQLRLRKGGYPVVPSWALIAGRAFHAACDDIDWLLHVGDEPTPTVVRIAWDSNFTDGIEDAAKHHPDQSAWKASGRRTKDKPNGDDGNWWRQAGAEMVKNYLSYRLAERNSGFDIWIMPDGEPAIEVEFEFEITPGVLVRGAIDRILRSQNSKQLLLRDLKTSQREPNDSSQLGIYAVAVAEQFGHQVAWGDYFMARKGEPSQSIDLRHFTKQLFADQYGAVAKMMKLNLYPANPGDACSWCDVRPACAIKGGVEAEQWAFVLP